MKKHLLNLSTKWLLVLLYTTAFILLVLKRNSLFWNQRKASIALVRTVTDAQDRQSTFESFYTTGVNEELAIFKSLYSIHPDRGGDLTNQINKQIAVNDSLFIEAEKKAVEEPELLQLLSQLKSLNKQKEKSLVRILELIRQKKYQQAVTDYESNLNNLFLQIHKTKSDLLTKVAVNDKIIINEYERKIVRINNLNILVSICLLILLASLGVIIFRLIRLTRKSNAELKESERKYRKFTEQTNEIIEKCDASGRFVFANNFFKRRLEYNDEDLSRLTISDILGKDLINFDQKGSKDEVITHVQKVLKTKSGKRVHIEGTILLEYKNGKFNGSMGFFNDVTEKKELEESLVASELKFRNFFNLAPMPMWVIDPVTNKFLLVNKAASKHYGYTEDEFYHMTVFQIRWAENILKESEDVKRIKEETLALKQNKTAKFNFNHVKKDGEKIEVEVYTSPIQINDRQCILSICLDVTERNQFENKLTKAIIQTQEEERYEIGSELHDNVCQILASAKMRLGMIRTSLDASIIPSFNQSCDAILLATKEIRNLSHRLAPAFFDNTKLEEAFDSLLKTFNVEHYYNINMCFDINSKNIVIDQEIQLNLYRILQEQLRNIITHSKCTDIEVKVFVHNNKLYMNIADNGVGFIIAEVKEGIGLTNMRRRAALFAGNLYINSSPGKGCEIMVVIPLVKTN